MTESSQEHAANPEGGEPASRPPEEAAPPPKPAPPRASPAEVLESLAGPISQGNWSRVRQEIAAIAPLDDLPPQLALVHAIATTEEDPQKSATEANFVAIRSMATLLGVADGSPLAIQLAKRLMRRNPLAWHRRQAPRAPARMLLVILALAFGAVGGWVLPGGGVRWAEVAATVFP